MRDLKQILKELNNFENKYKISILDIISAVETGIYDVYGNYYPAYTFNINLENNRLESTETRKWFYFEDFNNKWMINK